MEWFQLLVSTVIVCCGFVLLSCDTVGGFVTYEERLAIVKMAKDDALKNKAEKEKMAQLKPSDLIEDVSRNVHYPSAQAQLKTAARLLFEDLVNIAERNYIELRNGKVAQYEAMPLVDYKRRPGKMFTSEELKQLYDASGCELLYSDSNKDCSADIDTYLYRSVDGTCNNFMHPEYGSTATRLQRLAPPTYENGVSSPNGFSQAVCNSLEGSSSPDDEGMAGHCNSGDEKCFEEEEDFLYEDLLFEDPGSVDPCKRVPGSFSPPLPSADLISSQFTVNEKPFHLPFSDMLFAWGQFVANDIVNVPDISSNLSPVCDDCEFSDTCYSIRLVDNSSSNSGECLQLRRSMSECLYRYPDEYPSRQQLNDVTAFLDASVVYGSTRVRSQQLRMFKNGLLKSTPSLHQETLPVEDSSGNSYCKTSTAFVCGDFCCVDSDPSTYLHMLFLRLHNNVAVELNRLNPGWTDELLYQESRKIVSALVQKITYRDYLPKIFSGDYFDLLIGQYRGYKSSVNPQVSVAFSNIVLAGIYFPNYYHHIHHSEQSDTISTIIQRSREHGAPTYGLIKKYINKRLPTPTLNDVGQLMKLYGSLDNIDLVIGALAEKRMTTSLNRSALFGETFASILGMTFKAIRDGDRFFYQKEGVFTTEQYEQIDQVSLTNIVCELGGNGISTVSADIFLKNFKSVNCENVPKLDLSPWREEMCYIRIAPPPNMQHRSDQIISISARMPLIRVYTNERNPLCLPVTCPAEGSPQINFYSFLNIKDSISCTITSSLPSGHIHNDSMAFFDATLDSSMLNDHLVHQTLGSCETASQPAIKWMCPNDLVSPLDNTADSPNSMIFLPPGLKVFKNKL